MRRLFLAMAGPLLFDILVALWLGVSGQRPVPPQPTESARGYVVFFDWDGVALSASGRRTLAEAARSAALHGGTRVEVMGEVDHQAGPAYTAALALERARIVRSELLRDGLNPTDISVTGPGLTSSVPRRLQLVLQWTS